MSEQIFKHSAIIIALSSTALAMSPGLAFGENDGVKAQSILEEIVVTSKRRSQNLQDVAASIQVFSAETIENKQISSFDDYFRNVAGLSANNSGGGQTQLIMRGVNNTRISHANVSLASTVAFYFGDIPLTSSAFNPDAGLIDIERIEVLRGPQGTLYGASSMAGALKVIPKSPDTEEFSGEVSVGISSTEGGSESHNYSGIINVPLGDTAAIRGNAYSFNRGGYIDNVYSGEDDYNDEELYGGRITLRVEASDKLMFEPFVMFHKLEADGRPDEFIPGNPANFTGLNSSRNLVGAPVETPEQFNVTDEGEIIRIAADTFDDEFTLTGLTVKLDLDWAELTSITSYFDREFENTLDDIYRVRDNLGTITLDGTPLLSPFFNDASLEAVTQEIRLTSTDDGSVKWVLGAYYSDQDLGFVQSGLTPGLDDLLNFFGIGPVQGFDFGAPPDHVYFGEEDFNTEQLAFFAEATFVFGSEGQFEFTAGLRWFDYEQQSRQFRSGIANDGATTLDVTVSDDGVNPNFVFRYAMNEDISLYASASKGFRIGGVNGPVPLAGVFGSDCASDLASLGLSNLPEDFGPDKLWSYEVGAKSELADGRVRVNGAAYYIDWEDIQTQAFLPCGFATRTNEAGIDITGAELEIIAQLTEALNINASVTYIDSALSGDSVLLQAEKGDPSPYVSDWKLAAGFEYVGALDGFFNEYFVIGDLSYSSEQFSEFSDSAPVERLRIPSSTSVNLFLGLRQEDWTVSLYAKNLTDDRIVTGSDIDRRQPATFSVARPRTFGIDLAYRF